MTLATIYFHKVHLIESGLISCYNINTHDHPVHLCWLRRRLLCISFHPSQVTSIESFLWWWSFYYSHPWFVIVFYLLTKIILPMKQYYKSYYTPQIIDKLYSAFYYTTLIHYLLRWHYVIYYSIVTSILIYIHLIIYSVNIDGDYYTPSYLLLLWYMWICLNHVFFLIYLHIYIYFLYYTRCIPLILSILFYTVFCCKEQGGCCTRYTVWTYRSYLHSIHTSKLLIRAS